MWPWPGGRAGGVGSEGQRVWWLGARARAPVCSFERVWGGGRIGCHGVVVVVGQAGKGL